jgi:hypothetical protein
VAISAVTRQGLDALLEKADTTLFAHRGVAGAVRILEAPAAAQ